MARYALRGAGRAIKPKLAPSPEAREEDASPADVEREQGRLDSATALRWPSFYGAPDRMKLGTLMPLFQQYNWLRTSKRRHRAAVKPFDLPTAELILPD